MKISKYFSENELVVSTTGSKLGIKNIPNAKEKEYAFYTAKRMDEVREYLGVQLIVLSWFRCQELNDAVKGSKTSAHRYALAVDNYSNQISTKMMYEKLLKAMKEGKLQFDQLIYYPKQNFIHCGFKLDKKEERKQTWINN
ncbi:MAG: D-Ala-D-Ala carboxypeptidase family metallohydrolase [Fusobacteriaceae bacterium]